MPFYLRAVIHPMRRLVCLLLLYEPLQLCAQCDSASTRAWLRGMNPDTVCFAAFGVWECPDACFQSCMDFNYDSSYFRHEYRDTVSGLWSIRTYNNNELRDYHYNTPNDTDVYLCYDPGKCRASIVIKSVDNDSLTRIAKKQKTFYEYYSETVYDDSGALEASWVETIVLKRGKKFRRTVYLRPKRKFNKEKVRMKRV